MPHVIFNQNQTHILNVGSKPANQLPNLNNTIYYNKKQNGSVNTSKLNYSLNSSNNDNDYYKTKYSPTAINDVSTSLSPY